MHELDRCRHQGGLGLLSVITAAAEALNEAPQQQAVGRTGKVEQRRGIWMIDKYVALGFGR